MAVALDLFGPASAAGDDNPVSQRKLVQEKWSHVQLFVPTLHWTGELADSGLIQPFWK